MKWHADAFFSIGKTHMVCEDFAKAGLQQHGLPYAIVCDGCSSSRDTDTGARLLAHSAAFNMNWIAGDECSFSDREDLIIQGAKQATLTLDLNPRCLDATLVAAYASRNEEGEEGVRVVMRGDGVVVVRNRDGGGWGFWTVDHERNAPLYLSYGLDEERLEGYMSEFGDKCMATPYSSANGWVPAGPIPYQGHPPDWFFEAEYFDLVMVLSDGVHTFQERVEGHTSRTLENIPVEEVIEQLLRIRSTTGEFLKRRCHKFLTRYCQINDWQHADDFSAAAIYMEDPNG